MHGCIWAYFIWIGAVVAPVGLVLFIFRSLIINIMGRKKPFERVTLIKLWVSGLLIIYPVIFLLFKCITMD